MTDHRSDAGVIGASITEPAWFSTIFDRHARTIYRYFARRGCGDEADALTGEVFRIAFEARHRYRLEQPDALPWLYGIATNVLRTQRRNEIRRLDAARRFGARAEHPAGDDREARVDASCSSPEVLAAVAQLRPDDRDLLLLVAWEELTYTQVAIALDLPIGTVRSRLYRARIQLRTRLRNLNDRELPAQEGV